MKARATIFLLRRSDHRVASHASITRDLAADLATIRRTSLLHRSGPWAGVRMVGSLWVLWRLVGG